MSNAASNYSINKLYSGITIASSAALWISGISATALRKQKLIGLWFSLVTLAYGVMSSASSYVEEEQQYWYFVASTWFWWLAVKRYARGAKPKAGSRSGRSFNDPWSLVSAATPLLAVRVIRAWNQTGQKHAGEPDIARGFLPFHNHILWSLVCLVYVVVAGKMLPKDRPGVGRLASVLFAMLICTTALAFKIAFTMADEPELLKGLPVVHNGTLASLDLTTQARAVFSGILIFCLGIYFSSEGESSKTRSDGDMATQEQELVRNRAVPTQLESLHGVLTLFLVTQSRVSNIPLFALFELQMRAFASMDLSPAEISLTSIILQYASFFAFGGSNAISSIDLSNGYNGVSGYNAAMVGILTFCSNWAGPIWWTSATMILLGRFQGGWNSPLREFGQLTTCFAASSVLFMMLACTALRTHLFIWSVFSPKYLYVLAWNLGQHLCINMSSISLFVSLNSR